MSYPFKQYTNEELIREFNTLKNSNFNTLSPCSRLGKKCSNAFFQYERMNTARNGKLSNIEFYEKHKDKVMKYHNNDPHATTLFRSIHFLNKPPSQFSITQTCSLFHRFQVKSIFDPFAGWGDRLVGALATNIDYVGCDTNTHLIQPYKNLISFYKHQSKVEIIFKPAQEVIKSLNHDFDMMLSSPPFFYKTGKCVEHYFKQERDYDKFLTECLVPVVMFGLKHCKITALHLPEHMFDDIIKCGVRKCDEVVPYGSKRNFDVNNKSKQALIYLWKR